MLILILKRKPTENFPLQETSVNNLVQLCITLCRKFKFMKQYQCSLEHTKQHSNANNSYITCLFIYYVAGLFVVQKRIIS